MEFGILYQKEIRVYRSLVSRETEDFKQHLCVCLFFTRLVENR